MKKSALTAAIVKGEPVAAPPAPTSSHKSLLDPAAVPCLECAEGDDVPYTTAEALADGVQAMDLSHANNVALVGSVPTNIVTPKGIVLADYELNPRSRRGGKEMVPSTSPAIVGSLQSPHGSKSVHSNFLSEAIIGSLPKGLTSEQKLKIKQSVPMSPSHALLKEMSQDSVSSRTANGVKLRRQVLKGATIVFVTAGYSGKRFIFEKAKELGIRSVVLDGPDSWVQLLEAEGIITKFVPIDFTEQETVIDRCYAALKQVKSQLGELDGITTFCELAVPLATRLAEKFGLPGNTPEAVDNARDKYMTRHLMEAAGLPTPKHYRITSPDDLKPAAAHVGFPSVIKPVGGAASIGVIRVNNATDLDAAYKRVEHDMRHAKIVAGALVEGDEGDEAAAGNAGTWIQLVLMLEEYLDGAEVDCDLVFDEGRAVYGAITDNWPTIEPYFNETGSNCPSILPKATQRELLELSVLSVQALGFKLGVFHVECKATSRGPRLIEVNCRMGGGPVRNTNLLVWGVDLVEEHLMASAGIPVRPPVARKPLMQLAEFSINAAKSGILKHTNFLDHLKGRPDVLEAHPLVEAGHKCVCVKDGLPTWVCELMVHRPLVKDAIAYIKEIEAELVIPIE